MSLIFSTNVSELLNKIENSFVSDGLMNEDSFRNLSVNEIYTGLKEIGIEQMVCDPIQQVERNFIDMPAAQYTFGILYGLTLFVGILANVVIVYVTACRNIPFGFRPNFILSLAISNLLALLISLPVTSITMISRVWIFPDFFCSLLCPLAIPDVTKFRIKI